MASEKPFVIVGAGLAGARTAESLRAEGFTGPVTLVGEENELPYERPPLSKDYLMGTSARDATYVHEKPWYADQSVDLRLGVPVTGVDPGRQEITLADGECIGYAKLLLSTGSSPRRLPVPGAELEGVLYLRSLDDSDRIKEILQTATRVAVVGGGWIGLEIAAAARTADVEVTVLEGAELPLLRVLGREVAQTFADMHRRHGVDLRCSVQVAEITGDGGRASGVRLADGSQIPADAVIVGVGIVPNARLGELAGVKVDNGIVVDAQLRTSDRDIFAAGDVANAFHPVLGKHIRVEHWANAQYQPQVAAKAMLDRVASYDRMPYFFTDQYDLGMEYTGYVEPGGYDEVVFRGDVASSEFVVFWVSNGRVLAGMNVNVWDVAEAIEAIVRAGKPVDRRRLADLQVPLESLVDD
jgi:3-phenylpropionate/trans-cinnamate dioxygenase ferredoxin reductase component